jgi:hypothetical protein
MFEGSRQIKDAHAVSETQLGRMQEAVSKAEHAIQQFNNWLIQLFLRQDIREVTLSLRYFAQRSHLNLREVSAYSGVGKRTRL